MSKFTIDLSEKKEEEPEINSETPEFLKNQIAPKKPSVFLKVLKYFGVALLAFLLIGAIGGFFYWQNLKKTPQYSLALLVEAARRDDQAAVDALVDTDALVEDFVPQITDKAIELYGRNLPAPTLARITQVAAPLLPAVKDRAKAEIPALVRDKTKRFERVPFWAIALGAGRFLDITRENNEAIIKSNVENQFLELKMRRAGDRWQVVGIKDEELARGVAERIGQEIIALAKRNALDKQGNKPASDNLSDVLQKVEDIFK